MAIEGFVVRLAAGRCAGWAVFDTIIGCNDSRTTVIVGNFFMNVRSL